MKKLNRKGFTLIELLAVVVILAVILVVTIPAVLDTMKSSRDKSLEDAVDIVSNYVSDQYAISTLSAADSKIIFSSADAKGKISIPIGNDTKNASNEVTATGTSSIFDLAGYDTNDVTITMIYVIKDSGKVCIKGYAPSGSSFYDAKSKYGSASPAPYKTDACDDKYEDNEDNEELTS